MIMIVIMKVVVIVIVIVMIMIIQKEINFTHKTICHWECPDCAVKTAKKCSKHGKKVLR